MAKKRRMEQDAEEKDDFNHMCVQLIRQINLPWYHQLLRLFFSFYRDKVQESAFYINSPTGSDLLRQSESSWAVSRLDEVVSYPGTESCAFCLIDWVANKTEIDIYIKQVMFSSELYNRVYDILAANQQSSTLYSRTDFLDDFLNAWFGHDSTASRINHNCGYEHVNFGVVKRGNKITGLHAWLRLRLLVASGQGQIKQVIQTHPRLKLCVMKYTHHAAVKPYGTVFFGIPWDFELLLMYCSGYVPQSGDIGFCLGGEPVKIKTWRNQRNPSQLATAYFVF